MAYQIFSATMVHPEGYEFLYLKIVWLFPERLQNNQICSPINMLSNSQPERKCGIIFYQH